MQQSQSVELVRPLLYHSLFDGGQFVQRNLGDYIAGAEDDLALGYLMGHEPVDMRLHIGNCGRFGDVLFEEEYVQSLSQRERRFLLSMDSQAADFLG